MDGGRMAVCHDPSGAQFDLWQPKRQPGTDADPRAHGAPSWFENMTTDPDRNAAFYSKLFGWTPEEMPMRRVRYTTFKLGRDYIAGMMKIAPEMGPMPPHWATYFTVQDVDETARQAIELGATICVPAQDIPDIGRFCGITSPQGVTFFTIAYSR
jgi:predicted enzyme related to lactoylglutathione lyase